MPLNDPLLTGLCVPGEDILFGLGARDPGLSVWQRILLFRDVVVQGAPLLRQVLIPGSAVGPFLRQFIIRIDRLRRSDRNACVAIDAFVWMNYQEVRTFIETVHWADFYAVSVFAIDTGFGNDVGHGRPVGMVFGVGGVARMGDGEALNPWVYRK